MGKIASAATVYATAYLTEKGRTYLFNQNNTRFDVNGNDLFEIVQFTLADPDRNYNTVSGLTSGDVPDVAGNLEGILKTAADSAQQILAYYTIDVLSFVNASYANNLPGNILTISTDVAFPLNGQNDVPPAIPLVPVSRV